MTPRPSVADRPDVALRPVTIVMCLCVVLVIGSVAAVNLAVPDLSSSSLRPGAGALTWVVDCYVVVFGCLVIPAGAAGDRWGHARLVVIGLGVLAAGSVLASVAPHVGVLLAARALSGVGAAAVLPNTLAVLLHATPPARRLATIATWATMTSIGGVAGNVGGGALIALGSWRWLFAATTPVALVLAVLARRTSPQSVRRDRRLDPLGAVTLVAATVCLLVGIVESPHRGWLDPAVLAAFAAAVLLAAAWVVVELRVDRPMLDPRLFRIPALRHACIGMAAWFFGMFGLYYANASFLQVGKGYGALQAGLGIVPLSVPMMLAGRRAAGLPRLLGVPGTLGVAFTLGGAGLVGLSTCDADTLYLVYAAWLLVIGLGTTAAMPTLSSTITGALPPEQAGVGAGLQSTTRELGSALGVAITSTATAGVFVAELPSDVLRSDEPRTAARLLEAFPDRSDEIVTAFVSGVDRGLLVSGLVVLSCGALVVLGAVRSRHAPGSVSAGAPAAAGPSR